jgi:hypothetical protein
MKRRDLQRATGHIFHLAMSQREDGLMFAFIVVRELFVRHFYLLLSMVRDYPAARGQDVSGHTASASDDCRAVVTSSAFVA